MQSLLVLAATVHAVERDLQLACPQATAVSHFLCLQLLFTQMGATGIRPCITKGWSFFVLAVALGAVWWDRHVLRKLGPRGGLAGLHGEASSCSSQHAWPGIHNVTKAGVAACTPHAQIIQ